MRHPRRASLLVCLALGTSLAVGGALAAGPGDEVTVDGTVTGTDGTPAEEAVVLIGQDSTLTEHSPAELRELAADDPGRLTVVAVDDGTFAATVAWERAEAAVAVSEDGVSDLVYLRRENATVDLRLHERRPQTVHAHIGAVSADERRAELYVNMVNSGDATVENLSVVVVSLPENWSVATVGTNGSYHPGDREIIWSSVAPGGEVDTTVVLEVPAGTAPGEYAVELRAGSDTHRVDVTPTTVEVRPENTPGPTTMPPPGGDGTSTPTAGTPATTGPPRTDATGPGAGPVAAATAIGVLAALLRRRR
jgi:hypothetical protein